MQRSDFHYDLPPELIAQVPLAERRASRLLVLDGATGALADRMFAALPELVRPGDLLVLNDTRVLPARVLGRKPTGGRVECLLERLLGPRRALVHLRASHAPQPGSEIELPDRARAEIVARVGELFEVALDRDFVPFSRRHGDAVVAVLLAWPTPPTASAIRPCLRARRRCGGADSRVHFDRVMFDAFAARGVERAFLTLHVGAGTFAPVRTERVEDH
jgi:S-adenosylmethionine:tRNA ribosyltransferase-isomerase